MVIVVHDGDEPHEVVVSGGSVFKHQFVFTVIKSPVLVRLLHYTTTVARTVCTWDTFVGMESQTSENSTDTVPFECVCTSLFSPACPLPL